MIAVAVLLPGFGSKVAAVTVTVLLTWPAGGATTRGTVAVAPRARVPRLAVNTPPATPVVPWLDVAETNAAPAGSTSVSTTLTASLGPLLLTVIVKVTWSPTTTGPETEAVFVTARSATGVMVSVSVADANT